MTISQQARELKPCPFCGGAAVLDDLGDPEDNSFVYCQRCDVQQIANYSQEKAAALWNTRALETHAPASDELVRAARTWVEFWDSDRDSGIGEEEAMIDAIRAALSALPETGWRDISSAPKDGTCILVSFGERGIEAVMWDDPNDSGTGIWCVDDGKQGPYPLRGYSDKGPRAPTHWMPKPLPPPPADDTVQQINREIEANGGSDEG